MHCNVLRLYILLALVLPVEIVGISSGIAFVGVGSALAANDDGEQFSSMSLKELMDVAIISATGDPVSLRKAPSVVTVITAEEIKNMGALSLDTVLQTVPGVYVSVSPGAYLTPVWSIRGIGSDINPEVVLLLNGLPVKDTHMGNRSILFKMPVNMISRVEVVRGPGSAVYGADAFGGTVNVITKNSSEISGTEMGIGYGSFGTSEFWAQHGATYAGWDVVLGMEYQETEGDDSRVIYQDLLGSGPPSFTPRPLDTRHELLQTNVEVQKNRWTARFFSSVIDDAGLGPEALQFVGSDRKFNSERFMLDIQYQNEDLLDDVIFELRGSTTWYHKDEFGYAPPVNLWGGKELHEKQGNVEGIALYNGLHNHNIRLATGYTSIDQDVDHLYQNYGHPQAPIIIDLKDTPYAPLYDQNRSFIFGSVQDTWDLLQDLELTVGLRYDDYSDFGSTTNPRVALVWETSAILTSKILYGQAFRAPSFAELYLTNSPHVMGNEDLKPEEIETWELVFDYLPVTTVHTSLNLFYYTIDNKIEYAPDGVHPVGRSENNKEQEGKGGELTVKWQAAQALRFLADVAYQYSKDRNTNVKMTIAPELQFHLEANYHFLDNWVLNGQYFYFGERVREEGDPRGNIDDYDTINLTLNRKNILKHWDLSLTIHNILNQGIREPSPYAETHPQGARIPDDYPMESRFVYGELRYHF